MSKKTDSTIRLYSYEDDKPCEEHGSLIPGNGDVRKKHVFSPDSAQTKSSGKKVFVAIVAVFALAVLGVSGFGLVSQSNLASAPMVTIVNPYTQNATVFDYGPQVALAKNNFFIETRDAFIDERLTFVEVDMTQRQLRLFKRGVLLQSAEIFGVGEEGSWWQTPSGLYEIEQKNEQEFTSIGQVYLPWLITFQGNYLIHGWPTYPDESTVPEDFGGGGIRLGDKAAQALYASVPVGTPVLVHAADEPVRDTFIYQPQVLLHYVAFCAEAQSIL